MNFNIKKTGIFGCSVGCGGCDTSEDFPTPVKGFNTGTRLKRGGITGLVLLKCDSPLTDPTDPTEWQAALTAGDMVIRRDCFFQAGKTGDAQTLTVGACQTVVQTGIANTITGTDNADNSDNDVFALWSHLQANPTDYLVAFFTCDGVVYPFEKASVQATHEIEDTTEGVTRWNFTITYTVASDKAPLGVPATFIDSLTF